MKPVILIFPDIKTITEFILLFNISHAEVETKNFSLTTFLSEKELEIACNEFGAVAQNVIVKPESFIPNTLFTRY